MRIMRLARQAERQKTDSEPYQFQTEQSGVDWQILQQASGLLALPTCTAAGKSLP